MTSFSTYQYSLSELQALIPQQIWDRVRSFSDNQYMTLEATDKKTQKVVFLFLAKQQSKIRVCPFKFSEERDAYIKTQNMTPCYNDRASMGTSCSLSGSAIGATTSLIAIGNFLCHKEYTLFNYMDPQTSVYIYFIISKDEASGVKWKGFDTEEKRTKSENKILLREYKRIFIH